MEIQGYGLYSFQNILESLFLSVFYFYPKLFAMSLDSVHHLLGVASLSLDQIHTIFDLATQFKKFPDSIPRLSHCTVANVFFESSTRTKLSFELAEKRLGMPIIHWISQHSALQKGESLLDTIKNILAMSVDMLVIRHASSGAAHFLSQHVSVPIINAGDGTHAHPTQALLDAYTMRDYWGGDCIGKRVAIIGDIMHSRVAFSHFSLLKKLGMQVMACAPPTLLPKVIARLGVTLSYDLPAALKWCDVAYVLRIQKERQQSGLLPCLGEYQRFFGLNHHVMSHLPNPPVVMHPGPMNQNVEISDTLAAESPLILTQVNNGVYIRMAVLNVLAQAFYR